MLNSSTRREVWQRLLFLESHDLVKQRFQRIHGRELNARRAHEISAAAKQAREYFLNAGVSAYSVRPLLVFYGINCLSRSLLLLMKRHGGEEGLSAGHGIETVDWKGTMSGNVTDGLSRLIDLRVRTCAGFFSDLTRHTDNKLPIHNLSAAVDWRFDYDVPALGLELSVANLFSRIPDLRQEYREVTSDRRLASVSALSYNEADGLSMTIREESSTVQRAYEALGYDVRPQSDNVIVSGSAALLRSDPPQWIHTYIDKLFGAIPSLFVTEPFEGGARYSQLCISYLASYVLGMLVRYYPTHWIGLLQGQRGDAMWPTMNRALQYVEECYPELVAEMIRDSTAGI